MDNNKQRELLQDLVKNPKSFGLTEKEKEKSFSSTVAACEDNFNIYISVDNGIVKEAKFEGEGCAISFGATEAFMRTILDMKVSDVEILLNQYVKFVNGEIEQLDKEYLDVFNIVQTHLSRRKCALAPVEAIRKGIK